MSKLNSTSVIQSGNMKMPIIGLGTWQAIEGELEIALNAAIEAGYRHIDTAYVYLNEAAIGKVLKKLFEGGKIKREDLFIVSKLPNIANDAKYVEQYLKKSLASLQLDYLDLYLVHCPVGLVNENDNVLPKHENGNVKLDLNTDIIGIWKAMEAQVKEGRAKSIGLSNFNEKQIERVLNACTIKPTNLQVELHVYCQQKELREFCKNNEITICAYSPFASPNLIPFTKALGGDVDSIQNINPLKDPVVLRVANEHGKTPAQVMLRYLIQLGVAVIPKSSNPKRIKENFEIFDFDLSTTEIKELNDLDRGFDGKLFVTGLLKGIEHHPEFPYKNFFKN